MGLNRVRRSGAYAPLSAHYYKDDVIDEAGPEAELLYVRGLAFCAEVRKMPGLLRKQVLERDGYACRSYGSSIDLEIDHVYPWSRDGQHEMENLQVLCGPCNRRKGARV